jgi:hypothetical protein
MSFEKQDYVEFDNTLSNLFSVKSDDEIATLLRRDSKGTIENNRVKFDDSTFEGFAFMTFDKRGNLKDKVIIDAPDNFNPTDVSADRTGGSQVQLIREGDAYFITAAHYDRNRGNGELLGLNLIKIEDGEVTFNQYISIGEFENKMIVPNKEKIKKYNKKGVSASIKDIFTLSNGDYLLMGTISTNKEQFLLQIGGNGELKANYMSEMLEASGTNIPIGERGMKKTAVRGGGSDGGLFPVQPIVEEKDGKLIFVHRYQSPDMAQGTSSSTTEYSRTVLRIEEVFTYAKAYIIDPNAKTISQAAEFSDKILVGYDPLFIAKNGQVFLNGYDGKKWNMYLLEE